MKLDSLANKAFIEIRKKILSKQLPANKRLNEDEWAQKLGVSRMAVREALTRLQGEDLVMLGEKGGYFIKPILPKDVQGIRELREILELGAIRLAVKNLSNEHFENLENICNDFAEMVQKQYYNGALEADMKFHKTLVGYSGNARLLNVYKLSHIPLFHQKLGISQIGNSYYDQTDAEHRQIIQALKEENITLVEQTLLKHFNRHETLTFEIEE